MLVLGLTNEEDIQIGEDVFLRVFLQGGYKLRTTKLRIGILAPKDIPVTRIQRKEPFNDHGRKG